MAKQKKEEVVLNKDTLDLFLSSCKREYGKDCAVNMSALNDPEPNFSGSYGLDITLNIPFPEGRIIEIYGPEAGGKTSIGLEALGQAHLRGKYVAYIKVEKNLNRSLVNSIRTINLNKKDESGRETFILIQPDNGIEALDLAVKFVSTIPKSVVLFDSVDAILSEAELVGSINDDHVAKTARYMNKAVRKLDKFCEQNCSTIIFVNQERSNISPYGGGDVTSGGRGLRYYSSQRIQLKNITKQDFIKSDKGEVIGHNVRYYIKKNKVSPPFIEGSIPIIYGQGVFRELEIANLLRDLMLVDLSENGRLIQVEDKMRGIKEVSEMFLADPELFKKYISIVMSNYFNWSKYAV